MHVGLAMQSIYLLGLSMARDILGGTGILLDFHVMRHLRVMEASHLRNPVKEVSRCRQRSS